MAAHFSLGALHSHHSPSWPSLHQQPTSSPLPPCSRAPHPQQIQRDQQAESPRPDPAAPLLVASNNSSNTIQAMAHIYSKVSTHGSNPGDLLFLPGVRDSPSFPPADLDSHQQSAAEQRAAPSPDPRQPVVGDQHGSLLQHPGYPPLQSNSEERHHSNRNSDTPATIRFPDVSVFSFF